MTTKIAIFGSLYQRRYLRAVGELFAALRSYVPERLSLSVDAPFARYLEQEGIDYGAGTTKVFDGDGFDADLCLSLGGDGTFLHTASRVGYRAIPICGVNTGHLGYLASMPVDNPQDLAERLANGIYTVESRTMLRARTTPPAGSGETVSVMALNEIVVSKEDSASMVAVDASVNGNLLARYRADGLIISTPTGSTAYNLSVGGPIVAPTTPVLIISPIAAHTLTMRPVVVDNSDVIRLSVASRTGCYLMSYDGSSMRLKSDVGIIIDRAPYVTNIVLDSDSTFVDTLREKLLWGIQT